MVGWCCGWVLYFIGQRLGRRALDVYTRCEMLRLFASLDLICSASFSPLLLCLLMGETTVRLIALSPYPIDTSSCRPM